VVQLRDDVLKVYPVIADASKKELRLGLGEPQGWVLGPDRWKPYGHSR
jgi:hypothetical protein